MRSRCCLAGVMLSLMSALTQADVVSVSVDATQRGEPLRHVWSYYGFDECNYTTTPDCIDLMRTVAQINIRPTYLREHFLLNSGDGTATLKWGSTNIYTEAPDGRPAYSWKIMDPILDAVVASGCRPLVEIGFMPGDLSSRPEPYQNSDTYKLDGGCFYPPKDYEKWAELIREWARHSASRYKDVEESWLWELWNEPDIAYWHGTLEEYCKLFDHTEKALHEVLPRTTLGGPHTAGSGKFFRDFLAHCANGKNYASGAQGTRLDYIGFHAKGGVSLNEGRVRMDLGNQLRLHNRGFGVVANFPRYQDTPILIGEADPDGCAGCPSTKFPERAYRNVPAYGAYEAAMMKYSLDLARRQKVNLRGLVTWAFMFDGQPYFEGFRSLATNGIHKPVLNAFKMLGQLIGDEVPLTSDGALGLDEMLREGVRGKPDVNGMAVADDRYVKILLWNYHDDLVETEPATVHLKARLPEGFATRVRLTHYRIDDTHSNAYTKWVQLGSPQTPGPEMLAQLRTAMQLEMLEPARVVDAASGYVSIGFELPRFGLSLIILEKPE
ncbi:MAG: GH39 family glycosyl hydrolase [Solirubrobacterales bacterium]